VVADLPVPNLFEQALSTMFRFLPPDSMGLVRRVWADVITPNCGTFLSFGILIVKAWILILGDCDLSPHASAPSIAITKSLAVDGSDNDTVGVIGDIAAGYRPTRSSPISQAMPVRL
jgi:hypothetical protein